MRSEPDLEIRHRGISLKTGVDGTNLAAVPKTEIFSSKYVSNVMLMYSVVYNHLPMVVLYKSTYY